jgi:hypothetical protein
LQDSSYVAHCCASLPDKSHKTDSVHILEQREHPFWANVNRDSEGT